ncbi:copper amine oxidase [Nocardioides alcanivorans]|uniref:copper amine oxidase n=1 Tax=Nocardioides alcanivorans TaxID=2897352 RepID=UPI001F2D0E55|nr:hypothetical protein [Nocardioides alcanivorans]
MRLAGVVGLVVVAMVSTGSTNGGISTNGVSTGSTNGGVSTGSTNGGVSTGSTNGGVSPDDLPCPESMIEESLANGASWRMCARIDETKGLVLENVEFKPPTTREYAGYKRVLDQLWLAQLNVPYDNGLVQYNDITSYGFGGEHLIPQNDVTCPGDQVEVTQTYLRRDELVSRTVPGICTSEVETGLATHSLEAEGTKEARIAERGTALEVSSLSKISWYEYQQSIKLDDQGQLDIGLGATGDVAPGGPGGTMFSADPRFGWPLGGAEAPLGGHTHAASHWHNAIWRVDFGIDDAERQYVQQWDHENTAEAGLTPRLEGTGAQKESSFHAVAGEDIDERSWFRVVNPGSLNPDGHPRSYEIVNQNDPHTDMEVFTPLVSFTNAQPCQEYASMNLNADCPGLSVLDYVAQDTEELDDPVAWVNVGFHHVDRDEDQSPMHMHWQRFQLVPRDFFAQKPSTPPERLCINGAGWIDSFGSPCVATNIVPPSIKVGTTSPGTGDALRADRGIWNESRTRWAYSYLWYRDGEPILVASDDHDHGGDPHLQPVTGEDYVLRAEDLGAAITVRVTASQIGYPSGTAESAPLLVPEPPQTTPTKVASRIKIAKKKFRTGRRGVLVVKVTAPGTTPGGRVVVKRRGKTIASGALAAGRVKLKVKAIKKLGRHRVRVVYRGSDHVLRSAKRITVRVRK